MKNARPPEFVTNVYRDLRDRRLLLPVVLLAVALVAVPVLLTSHAKPSTVPATSAPKASDSAAVPAVATQQFEVTNYKKRLDRLQSKDPFNAPPSASPDRVTNKVKNASITSANIPSTGSTGSSSATASSSSSTSASTPTTSSTASSTPVTGGTTPSSSTPATAPQSSGGSGGSSGTKHHMPTARYYAYRVGVKVGEPGKLKDRSEVKRMTMLPSSNRPLATFLGVAEDGKHALFGISSDVDSVKGDGRCAPQPANCQYLALSAGDKVNLHYAPGNKRYNLLLTDIHPVIVGNRPPGKAKGAVQSGHELPKLGPG